jgi:hypothetical protein
MVRRLRPQSKVRESVPRERDPTTRWAHERDGGTRGVEEHEGTLAEKLGCQHKLRPVKIEAPGPPLQQAVRGQERHLGAFRRGEFHRVALARCSVEGPGEGRMAAERVWHRLRTDVAHLEREGERCRLEGDGDLEDEGEGVMRTGPG